MAMIAQKRGYLKELANVYLKLKFRKDERSSPPCKKSIERDISLFDNFYKVARYSGTNDVPSEKSTRNDESFDSDVWSWTTNSEEKEEEQEDDVADVETIQQLKTIYERYDPMNILKVDHRRMSRDEIENNVRRMDYFQRSHLVDNLKSLNADMLRDTSTDTFVNAVVSFILKFDDESLLVAARDESRHGCSDYARLLRSVMDEREHGYVFELLNRDVRFLKCNFKMLKDFFEEEKAKQELKTCAVLQRALRDERFLEHLYAFAEGIYNDKPLPADVAENDSLFQNEIFARRGESNDEQWHRIDWSRRNVARSMTGQACCGKTTLLNTLRDRSWEVYSRGKIGQFAGKSSLDPKIAAPQIAAMHGALDFVLCTNDERSIGDRNAMDNPLWTGVIMPQMDFDVRHEQGARGLVDAVLRFVERTQNLNSLRYYASQRTVVFVDPYPSRNRARMLKRCTGGDPHRARIHHYPYAQAVAYYTIARILGWKVYYVPYKNEQRIDDERMTVIAESIHESFEREPSAKRPRDDNNNATDEEEDYEPPCKICRDKPNTSLVDVDNEADFEYAKSVKIYK